MFFVDHRKEGLIWGQDVELLEVRVKFFVLLPSADLFLLLRIYVAAARKVLCSLNFFYGC